MNASQPRTAPLGEACRIQTCPTCGRHILAALLDGVLPTRVDPEPLDPVAELQALLEGRMVYDILIYGVPRKMHLRWRYAELINAGHPHPVVADHRCHHTHNIQTPRQAPVEIVIPYSKGQANDIPPF